MLILIAVFSCSCADEKDEEPPRVILESPYENQTFLTVDSIEVVVGITDNEQIKSIKVGLVDEDYNDLGIERSYPASGTSYTLATDFLLEEPFLESGSYYLAVRASDGENVGSGYVRVQLTAIERVVENLLVVTANSTQTKVYTGENMGDWSLKGSYAIDLAGAALNYRQNLLGLAGGVVGDAVFYETEEFTATQTIAGFGSPSLPYFVGLEYDLKAERFLLLQRDQQLRILDKSGLPKSSAQLTPNFIPVKAFPLDTDIFVDQKSITGDTHVLSKYASSGLVLNSYSVTGPVREISKRSQNESFIWVDGDEGTNMSILNNTNNLVAEVYNREGEPLYAAREIGQGNFIISTSGGLLRYTYPSGGTVILNTNLSLKALYYDDLNGFIYGTEGNTLYQISLTGVVIDTFTFSETVAYFAVDYNR